MVKDTEHCTYCDYCVESLDHHCPWSSKCIARGNMPCFKAFITGTIMALCFVIVGCMFVFGMTASESVSRRHHAKPVSPH